MIRRLTASAAVLVLAATYLLAQIDFARRHRPGIAPERYLRPQVLQIWAPGLGVAAVLAFIAWLAGRRRS